MEVITEHGIILHLDENNCYSVLGEYITQITNRKDNVNPTLFVGAKYDGTMGNKPPKILGVDHIGILDLQDMVELHFGIFKCFT